MSVKKKTPESDADKAEKTIDDAITKLKGGDDGAHWEPEVIEAARYAFKNDKPLFQRKRSKIKDASNGAQITDWTKEVKGDSGDAEDATKSGEIVELVQECSILFHDEHGECFVSFEQDDHVETWNITSQGFFDWVSYKTYRGLGFVSSDTAMKAAIVTLRGIATHDGKEISVFLRCAPWQNGHMIDLADDQWQAVEVLPTGWRVIKKPPVKFVRSNTAMPLPAPLPGGNFGLWWNYLNIKKTDQTLILADALDSWRDDTPYTVLDIIGEQGSGKSTTHVCYRQVTDPNSIPLRAAPKSVDDLFVSASANHQASYENMSNMPAAMQDGLCTLSTGGGYGKRKLYSNSDEATIDIKRKVVINAIVDVVTRPDLIDRVIRVELPMLKNEADEIEFKASFERDRAAIFGGLLDLFASALSILPSIELASRTRMVGFSKLGEAVHKVLEREDSFLSLYQANKDESLALAIESSPAATAVMAMMEAGGWSKWTGTQAALKIFLERNFHQAGEGWPKSAKGLGTVLRRMTPALRSVGIDVKQLGHKRDGWHVCISKRVKKESQNNRHKDHTVTESSKSGQETVNSEPKCDHVTVVNVKSDKKIKPDGDIHDKPKHKEKF